MKEFSIRKLSAERCTDLGVSNAVNVVNIFDEEDYINIKNLFLARFNRIPNLIELHGIDCQKAYDWFSQTYQHDITECFYSDNVGNKQEAYFFLFDDMLAVIRGYVIHILFRKTDIELVNKVVNGIKKFKKASRNKPEIELLVNSYNGLETKTVEISRPKCSIEDNYNNDFLPIHQIILSRLRKKNDKGLVLLHGKPGTGKTSYIRYLITKTKKKVIFLPPNMAASITDPGLMNVLINNPNSVFVIEDAENIIIDRNRSGSSSVSALLNLADGLLSDCLNIQIICSFNTDLSRVDSALTRKGRLIAKYEFSELSVSKSQALSNKLGFSSVIDSPMTLAAVYNQHETEFSATSQCKKIGFNLAG